ncbi:unnamed protein product, partial [Sphacelaria rigidula]
FQVQFPPRLLETHLVVLRNVLSDDEIAVLEDVLRLMRGANVSVIILRYREAYMLVILRREMMYTWVSLEC